MTEQPGSQAQTAPAKQAEDPQARVARLRAALSEAESALPPKPNVTRIQVDKPHEFFTFGSATVGPSWTEVPNILVPSLLRAADEAGVTLITEG